MTSAVIGVVKDCGWEYLRNYAVSLSRCGFDGDKVLFVDNITDDAFTKLLGLGFTLVNYNAPKDLDGKKFNSWEDGMAWGFFGRWRFAPVIDWLKMDLTPGGPARIDNYRYIVWCDVRDVMFQLDPIEWMNDQSPIALGHLYGAAEGCIIKDQPHNANWVQRTAPALWHWMQNEEVLCSGTFAGDASTMLKVFEHMYGLHESVKDMAAFDQGLWNVTARTHPFKTTLNIPKMKKGFCATGWPSKAKDFSPYTTDTEPVWNWEDMICEAPETGIPFAIVHQYDREPRWRDKINDIMSESAPVERMQQIPANPMILIVSCEAYRHNGIQDAIRNTWAKGLKNYKFLLGHNCLGTPIAEDELVVLADDDYASICWKQREAYKALLAEGPYTGGPNSNPYTHVFTCCTDTYVIPDRLWQCGYEKHAYCGSVVQHAASVMGNIPFAQGGAGFWLNRRALAILANDKSCRLLPPDIWVSYVLSKFNIPCAHAAQAFWHGFPVPEPFESDKVVTMHLSRGTGKYDPEWMLDVHGVFTRTGKLPVPGRQPL
jgi:hypothetical protein